MKTVDGNLVTLALNGEFDVIIHGCNCFCTMGAGIAREIKNKFYEAFVVDSKTVEGDKSKLGTITYASIPVYDKHKMNVVVKGDVSVGEFNHVVNVVNGYTQYNYYGKALLVEYDAVRLVFRKVKELFSGKRIGYPKIGAGLAGGDWSIIEKIINEELKGEDHTLVLFKR